jgi:prepilin peptidase CpaA
MDAAMSIFLTLAVLIAAWAALTDVKTGLIPNWLTLSGMLSGVGGHFLLGAFSTSLRTGLMQGGVSLAGLLFCGLAPFLLFWRGAMGGGDVKLFAAIGALCHPLLGIEAQMYALVFAAIFAPLRLAMEGRLLRVLAGSFSLLLRPHRGLTPTEPLPESAWFRLGPCILAGTAATLAFHAHELFDLSTFGIQP